MLGLGLGTHKFRGNGSGVSLDLDPDYLAWEDEFNVTPLTARRIVLNQLVLDLKAGGVFTKLDRLWIFAMHDQQAARVSVVNPSSTQITEVNSPGWTTDLGYFGAVTAYLDTNFVDNAGTNWVFNDGSYGTWHTSWTATNVGTSCGSKSGAGGSRMRPEQATTTQPRFQMQSVSFLGPGGPVADGLGLSAGDKLAGVESFYKDGVLVGNPAHNNAGLSAFPWYVMATNQAGSAAGIAASPSFEHNAFFIGASLTAGEHLALYNAINTYFTVLGI